MLIKQRLQCPIWKTPYFFILSFRVFIKIARTGIFKKFSDTLIFPKKINLVLKFINYIFCRRDKVNIGYNLFNCLISLGPGYIKFGQALSTRPDLLGQKTCEHLQKLQDDIKPFPGSVAKKIFEHQIEKPIEKIFKKNYENLSWSNAYDPKKFIKDKFTNKKLMNSEELKKMYGNMYKNPSVNLDMDFSVSKGGYRLKPHRDDITRLYNFLIYLNDIPKKNGGSLTIYQKRSNVKIRNSFGRFPKKNELSLSKEFTPKKGSVIFFQSTPNSYHGVKRFKEHRENKRFFIYGSYALSAPVIWRYKNVTYYPFINSTNKKLLTSGHSSNYKLKRVV